MSLNDPIGDMLSRIKNSQSRNHKKVELPSSNFKIKISEVLKNEGYIIDYKVSSDEKKPTLEIELKLCFEALLQIHHVVRLVINFLFYPRANKCFKLEQ